ncbi:3-hydroxybutyryl-CoA dehydratase [Hahella sp. KA22]|uniref:MaoC/PaaZ C-terminal domain-containing protein n=1 Tax=Hahella sp. KA22 TaxID=1628392 RepID=UPI000FDD8646|nr:MaoC/PaaZ C-terminal domain-containing protein [Hahella sp. KA22]AZZ93069.1 3-hydroxybutyryl-CoA dehydratase [Hahella sp. KA22]QAY56443.1 3-hydroxybutyryl-CoA dehydratase [Hahella sp. KA22]
MDALENITYDELHVGDSATYTRTLTEQEIVLFAAVSGDINPVHLDAEYAQSTVFKERIGHGMWSGALISAALATVIPGPGTIYLEQHLSFKRPVKLNDVLTVTLTVTEKLSKKRVVLDCAIHNQNGVLVVEGQAKVIAPDEKISLERPTLPAISISGDH